jgi:catechol 2,3-dioxygenase-like lactoylglutathione lyase family enzyme
MAPKRMHNAGIVVDDLEGTINFFRELGFRACENVVVFRLADNYQDLYSS